MSRAPAALAALCLVAVALAGCTGPTPPSPVAAIPKVIVDYQDNETRLYMTSVNADVRYGNLSMVIGNDNLTAHNFSVHASKAFVLNASTNLTFFTLNATADEAGVHYYYNATFHIADRTPANPNDPLVYQAYIRDTPDGPIKAEALPSFHILTGG